MKLPWQKDKLEKGVALPKGKLGYMQLIEIALKNLFYKKLRTSLTIAGVVVGVGSVTFLLSFGFGLRDVVSRQVVDSNSVRTIDVSPAKANLVKIDDENIQRIETTPGVVKVAPVFINAGKVQFNNANTEGVVYGTDQEYLSLISFKRTAGDIPNFKEHPKDIYISSSYIKAVGLKSADQILGKELSLQVTVQVPTEEGSTKKTLEYTGIIGGIFESTSGTELYVNDSLFTDNGITEASQLKVLAASKEDVPTVQKKIEALGFVGTSPLQTLEQINQIFGILNILFLGFGGIGLIIATLGMFNTLTISLLERTKEIGLMVALGARHKDIKRLFVIEAVGLAFIGGVLGIIGAGLISLVVNTGLNSLASSRGVTDTFYLFSYPAFLVTIIIVASLLLGYLVVYFPARRAAKINPIDALRS
ncbi:ABC transporter permease [Candidatus Saccharibacteria bacterium]|nr:ABC transporter permease [Candidatus Saccharibacteria bacterium]